MGRVCHCEALTLPHLGLLNHTYLPLYTTTSLKLYFATKQLQLVTPRHTTMRALYIVLALAAVALILEPNASALPLAFMASSTTALPASSTTALPASYHSYHHQKQYQSLEIQFGQ